MKKHHFHVFRHEKHFEPLPQPHFQTGPKSVFVIVVVGEFKKKLLYLMFGYVLNIAAICIEPTN